MKHAKHLIIISIATLIAQFAFTADECANDFLPDPVYKVVSVPGNSSQRQRDSRLLPAVLTKSGLIAVGSIDNYIYFYNQNGELHSKIKTDLFVTDVLKFNDGTIAATSADGYVYFMTPTGELIKKVQFDPAIYAFTYSTILNDDTLAIINSSLNVNRTIKFINSNGDVVRSYTFNGKTGTSNSMMGLSTKPFETPELGLVLAGRDYSFVQQPGAPALTRFNLGAWQDKFSTLRNADGTAKTLVSNVQGELKFADMAGNVTKTTPDFSHNFTAPFESYREQTLIQNSEVLITLSTTGNITRWTGANSSSVFRPTSDFEEDGHHWHKEPIDPGPTRNASQLIVNARNYALVWTNEVVREVLPPGSRQQPLKPYTVQTLYAIGADGKSVPGVGPLELSVGYTNSGIVPINYKYVLVQGYTDGPANTAYIVDVDTLKPVAKIKSAFTLNKALQISQDQFVFTDAGNTGRIMFVKIPPTEKH